MSAPSPTFKLNVTSPIYVPKETGSPLPDLHTPAYNAQQNSSNANYNDQSNFNFSQPTTPRLNYNSLQNYNTAPRGWGQNKLKPTYSDF